MSRTLCKLLACLAVLFCTKAAMGRVSLRVDVGWNGAFRAARWAPVYITAADDEAIAAANFECLIASLDAQMSGHHIGHLIVWMAVRHAGPSFFHAICQTIFIFGGPVSIRFLVRRVY